MMSNDMRREQERQAWEAQEQEHLVEEKLREARRDAKVAVSQQMDMCDHKQGMD